MPSHKDYDPDFLLHLDKSLKAAHDKIQKLERKLLTAAPPYPIANVYPVQGQVAVDQSDDLFKWYSNGAWRFPGGGTVPNAPYLKIIADQLIANNALTIVDFTDNDYWTNDVTGANQSGTDAATLTGTNFSYDVATPNYIHILTPGLYYVETELNFNHTAFAPATFKVSLDTGIGFFQTRRVISCDTTFDGDSQAWVSQIVPMTTLNAFPFAASFAVKQNSGVDMHPEPSAEGASFGVTLIRLSPMS